MAILKDVSKPSYEELLAEVAALKAAQANPASAIGFAQSKTNPKFWTFKHGTRDAWPVSTSVPAWRAILANVKMIESKLPKA